VRRIEGTAEVEDEKTIRIFAQKFQANDA